MESEFGLCGVVGGMSVIVMLAYTMRHGRISSEAVAEPQCGHYAVCERVADLLKKANSEVASLQGQPRIGDFAFDEDYGNIFR